eukprot:TRINITY_DN39973_c0_g1_i1.p2 TRINITY_DN39973_c0_g1~~TRINITY_DN39973_c0_g1_i1.p2  ORF type:complete len:105 (+),score=34.65 TRINITY_DN39973_c0_g1_i1:63-377(+)
MVATKTVVTAGHGRAAAKGDTVTMAYKGTLKSGKVFDSNGSFKTKIGAGHVIPCWDSQVVGMKLGEHSVLHCSSDTAYGAAGTPGGPIPPNADLTFDVTLKAIA